LGIEIERKFLVDKDRWLKVKPKMGDKIIQGYLLKSIEKTIRVRVKGNRGFITIICRVDFVHPFITEFT